MLGYLILLSVPLLIYLFRESPGKKAIKSGKEGEKRVSGILRRHGFRVLDDVLFKIDGRSVQVDHIAVSEYCLLVVETKNHRGLISGDPYEKDWRQVSPSGRDYKLYNPIWQNYGHKKTVEKLLGVREAIPVIVFASDPIVNVRSSGMMVTTARELPGFLNAVKKERLFSEEEVKNICEKIKIQNCNNKYEIKRHIESVRERAVL